LRRISTCAVVAGAFIAVTSLQSYAAGLGRLEVKSVLGEPLRAEVSVSAKPAEISSLQARLASPDAYEAAGLVYTGIVSQLSVSLNKDAQGEPTVTVTSSGPVNEPVVDLLLELTWSSGRVTREYTAFIDPPFIVAEREKRRMEEAIAAAEAEKAAQGAETRPAEVPEAPTPQPLPDEMAVVEAPAAPTQAAVEEPAATEPTGPTEATVPDLEMEQAEAIGSGPVETIGGTEPTLFTSAPEVSAPMESAAMDPAVMDPAAMSEFGSESDIGVIRGDTLSKIALARKPDGVTLEQMLVVLFRNNPQAFSGNNMNRLRAGKVIRMPDSSAYSAVTAQEARQEVRIQYGAWNTYRERVAAAAMQQPATEQPAQQAVAGAITPKIEDPAPSAAQTSPEVVKLSKGEPAAASAAGADQANVRALEEQLVAREKALQESNARVARLENIIEDLQKLAEVKNEDMAQLQEQAASAAATAPPDKMPATEQPPAQTPPPAQSTAAPPAQPGTTTPAAPATPSEAPVSTPAKAPAPATPPQQRRTPPPPPPPSLIDQAMEQPVLLAVPVVVLLLIGFAVVKLRGRKREAKSVTEEDAPAELDETESVVASSPAFSPTSTGTGARAGESDEVDPLEEAEIFLAYGRDAQAEDLLKEALETHPARFDIHAKLLEIYANRSDKAAFEALARDVQQGTGGEGEIWDRVVALGYSLDPENPRYADGKGAAAASGGAFTTSSGITSTTDRLDFEVGLGEDADASASPDFDPSSATEFDSSAEPDPDATIDQSFDIDNDPTTIQIRSNAGLTETDLDLSSDAGLTATDLDLSSELPDFEVGSKPASDEATMDLGSGSEPEIPEVSPPDDKDEDAGLDFNMDGISLGTGDDDGEKTMPDSAPSDMAALDLSGISLDLDGASAEPSGSADKDEKWYEVQTKFDLAKAYQEMGDKDGAREILQEVMSEGDPEQKAAAETVLASLD
jgi:pilus assembly protein FimV